MEKETLLGKLQKTTLRDLFRGGKNLRQPVLLETNDRLSIFYGTCTPEEIKILEGFPSFLRDKVASGKLPHLGVLLVGGCANPEKKGRRKDIDLRITTETPIGIRRDSAVDNLHCLIPGYFQSIGIECTVGNKQTGVPRMVTAYTNGRKIQLLLKPTKCDIATTTAGSVRPFDIFIQSHDDPPLSQHHIAERSFGGQYLVLLDTSKNH